ncbi:MAG: hypothetical protein ACPG5B_10695 [Chitinophagales bacterium]
MVNIENNLIETYLTLINKLSNESKLEIIAQLSLSMKNETKNKKDNSITHLFGSFDTEETAQELIERIREARVFNRKIINFS